MLNLLIKFPHFKSLRSSPCITCFDLSNSNCLIALSEEEEKLSAGDAVDLIMINEI